MTIIKITRQRLFFLAKRREKTVVDLFSEFRFCITRISDRFATRAKWRAFRFCPSPLLSLPPSIAHKRARARVRIEEREARGWRSATMADGWSHARKPKSLRARASPVRTRRGATFVWRVDEGARSPNERRASGDQPRLRDAVEDTKRSGSKSGRLRRRARSRAVACAKRRKSALPPLAHALDCRQAIDANLERARKNNRK